MRASTIFRAFRCYTQNLRAYTICTQYCDYRYFLNL